MLSHSLVEYDCESSNYIYSCTLAADPTVVSFRACCIRISLFDRHSLCVIERSIWLTVPPALYVQHHSLNNQF